MNRFLTKDFLAGLMFVGFGGLAYIAAFTDLSRYFGQSKLALGTAVRMGPGFVPQMLAFIMMALGAIIAISAVVTGSERIEGGKWKPIVMVTLGVVAFAVLFDPGNVPAIVSWFVPGLARWENPVSGLLPALIALVFLAAAGGDEFKWGETAIMCVALAVLCFVIFKWGLSMNIAMLNGVW
ncbi:tripartite tricarboxylate transporter TctB family protein [Reyranella sp. CPCC 100927]|uniref:tripartite tricarboxylate transporter TctB family protein n=1 Tax=Reyranella sp. CPCC 100927 TaxID=2599616 RepID=UPI0011B5DF11|nr:tripartite tricarboxylate transporter TctB family protein [Reyranella sp. CPCC 100927]TWT13746.1 tripartite tricarboxylate transporter TctB family protein [Reyranella sp. CPCC 100927]